MWNTDPFLLPTGLVSLAATYALSVLGMTTYWKYRDDREAAFEKRKAEQAPGRRIHRNRIEEGRHYFHTARVDSGLNFRRFVVVKTIEGELHAVWANGDGIWTNKSRVSEMPGTFFGPVSTPWGEE